MGVSARISALVYNTGKLKPAQLPQSVLDLADPQWKGKIELAPSETDFWPVVSSVAKAYGPDRALAWLKGLKANAGSGANVPDNETLVSDVSQGNTQLALINHYYFYRLQAEQGKGSVHAAIAYFKPHDPGYVEDISGAAVLKSSTHQAAAQQLLNFLTSRGTARPGRGRQLRVPAPPGRGRQCRADAARPAAAQRLHPRRAGHRPRRQDAAPARRAAVVGVRSA